MKEVAYKLFNGFFSIVFIVILISSIFNNKITLGTFVPLIMIVCITLIILLWFFLSNKIKFIKIKNERFILVGYLLILTIIQLFLANKLSVTPSWDFGMVYNGAKEFALTNNFGEYAIYFKNFSNNIPILLVFSFIFKICNIIGLNNFYLIGIIVNILFINTAIMIMYLTVKKKYGFNKAILSLFIILFFSPIFLYTPIFYTDTITLIFPILLFYLYTLLDNKNDIKYKNMIIIVLPIVAFIGGKIKFTPIIAFIAIIIDALLNKKIKLATICVTILAVCYILFNIFINNIFSRSFNLKETIKIPYTHWVMMGLSEESNGVFNQNDFNFTLSFSTEEEREKAIIINIKERLQDYGLFGYTTFLINKANGTWSDGTYFAPEKLRRYPSQETGIHKVVLSGGDYFTLYFYFAISAQLAFIILMIYCSIQSIIFRRFDETNSIRLAIFGLLMFLLIWETRSRYLINFIPIFIISFIDVFDKVTPSINIKENFKKLLRTT